MASIWAALSAIWTFLQAFAMFIGLIKSAQSDSDKAKAAEGQANTEAREKAVDEQKNAQAEDDFDKAQDSIVSHIPKP